MLIRAEDGSVYNLDRIERLEVVEISDGAARNQTGAENSGGEAKELYALRAYIGGQAHDLVGPTDIREEADAALNRLFNMVSEHADLHRPNASRSV